MTESLPAWAVMWTVSGRIFAACKAVSWRHTRAEPAGPGLRVGYFLAWPGLDATAFLSSPAPPPPTTAEWLRASAMTTLGLALVFGLARLAGARQPLLAGWIGMIGLVLVLHFGAFALISCLWRRAGVHAAPLMRAPVRSTSLGEFWGRRWNTAFRDLTHHVVFAPLSARIGARAGLVVGFLWSGLLHEAVISWPAGGGYGGPTVYFVAQAVGLLAERSRVGRRAGLGRGWRGRAFAVAVLLLPLPALFHARFVTVVIVPFLHALGAVGPL